MGGPDLRGVGGLDGVNQTPTPAVNQPDIKATHEGRTWSQRFDTIKAALIRIFTFSRKKTDKSPDIKRNSVRIVRPAESFNQGKTSKVKNPKSEPPKSDALEIKDGTKIDPKAKVDEISHAMGKRAGDAVESAVSNVVSVVGNFGLGIAGLPSLIGNNINPKKPTEKIDSPKTEKDDSPKKLESLKIPTTISVKDDKKLYETLESLKEFKSSDQAHLATVQQDLKTLDGISSKLTDALNTKEKASLKTFIADYKNYADKATAFHEQLSNALPTVDQAGKEIDLAETVKKLNQLFESPQFEQLTEASNKLIKQSNHIKAVKQKIGTHPTFLKMPKSNEFSPEIRPVQRMPRYELMLRDIKGYFAKLNPKDSTIEKGLEEIQTSLTQSQGIAKQANLQINSNLYASTLKEFLNEKITSTFVINEFQKLLSQELKVYDKGFVRGEITHKELSKAIKLDVKITEGKMDGLIEKNNVQAQKELDKLKFALEHYKVGSRKKIEKWQAKLSAK